jgi:hypothetical protein
MLHNRLFTTSIHPRRSHAWWITCATAFTKLLTVDICTRKMCFLSIVAAIYITILSFASRILTVIKRSVTVNGARLTAVWGLAIPNL